MAVSLIFLLLNLLLPCFGDILLHSVTGEVGSGNYTYYSLMYEGPITLTLTTQLGDADLYVSQLISKPTFDPNTYCLQSSTCGVDVIHIPKSFKRPIGIGIYGHSSHEISRYLLEVTLRETKADGHISDVVYGDDDEIEEEYEFDLYIKDFSVEDRIRLKGQSKRKVSLRYPEGEEGSTINENSDEDKSDEEPFMWKFIWSLMELIFEIFFL